MTAVLIPTPQHGAGGSEQDSGYSTVKVFDKGRRWKWLYSCMGLRKMQTTRAIRGMWIKRRYNIRGILRQLSEVQKRNKLKTGICGEEVTGTYIWTNVRMI